MYAPLTEFNAFDSASVPQIVAADSALHLCTPSAAGSCDDEAGTATVILSGLRNLGEKSVGVRLIVSQRRREGRFQR